jgi:hypothetical protein
MERVGIDLFQNAAAPDGSAPADAATSFTDHGVIT